MTFWLGRGQQQVAVRVKTKTSDAHVFQWNAKEDGGIFGEIGVNDFSVLVDIPASQDEFPQFYPTDRGMNRRALGKTVYLRRSN
jgi:hypothetical protein